MGSSGALSPKESEQLHFLIEPILKDLKNYKRHRGGVANMAIWGAINMLGCPWYLVNGLVHPYKGRLVLSPVSRL